MRSLLYLLVAFLLFFGQGLSIPIPAPPPPPTTAVPQPGDFVGVRPFAYEQKSKENKKVSIHPGVVVAGPSASGMYQVAMVSKSLPDKPPQAGVETFHPDAKVYGNVNLAPPKDVHVGMMKPWKDGAGNVVAPMNQAGLQKLQNMMKPHVDWKPTPSAPSSKKK